MLPSSSRTSTSTVGLPRESRISRPAISRMAVMAGTPYAWAGSRGAGWLLQAAGPFRGIIMTLFAPVTLLTAIATVLAILVSLWTAIRVARTRRQVGIDAPAMTGSPELERALRVQGNTVEQFVLF